MPPVVDRRRPEELERPREAEQRQHADLAQLDALLAEVDREDLVEDAERDSLPEVEEADPEQLVRGRSGAAIVAVSVHARAGTGRSRARPADWAARPPARPPASTTRFIDAQARAPRGTRRSRRPCTGGCWACRTTGRAAPSDTGMRPAQRSASRCDQWPKFGNVTIASRPTRSISATMSSVWRIACSVCDRITQSNDASSKPASPRSRSLWITLTPFAHAREHAGVVDLDAVAASRRARARGTRAGCRRRSPGRARCAPRAIQPAIVAKSARPAAAAATDVARRTIRSRDLLAAPSADTSSSRSSVGGDALEVRAHERVVLRVVEQERVVAVRRVDLGVARRRAGCRPAPSRSRASARAGSASRW